MYVILGATGKTGSVVANRLLDKGKKVRVLGRDTKKLAVFTSRGAEGFTANVTDAEALSRAFAGAEAVYAMIPPDPARGPERDHRVHRHGAGEERREACRYAEQLWSGQARQDRTDRGTA